MILQKQKDSILKAIETLSRKELVTDGERKRLEELSNNIHSYSNPLDICDTQEIKSVDTEVFDLAYKYDYDKEIDKILCSWKFVED